MPGTQTRRSRRLPAAALLASLALLADLIAAPVATAAHVPGTSARTRQAAAVVRHRTPSRSRPPSMWRRAATRSTYAQACTSWTPRSRSRSTSCSRATARPRPSRREVATPDLRCDPAGDPVSGLTLQNGMANSSQPYGGAIAARSVTVSASVFADNAADRGGAIWADAIVRDSTFIRNSAGATGGAIELDGRDHEQHLRRQPRGWGGRAPRAERHHPATPSSGTARTTAARSTPRATASCGCGTTCWPVRARRTRARHGGRRRRQPRDGRELPVHEHDLAGGHARPLHLGQLAANGGPTPRSPPRRQCRDGDGLASVCAASPVNGHDQRGVIRRRALAATPVHMRRWPARPVDRSTGPTGAHTSTSSRRLRPRLWEAVPTRSRGPWTQPPTGARSHCAGTYLLPAEVSIGEGSLLRR